MPKLNDIQLILLSAAAQRDGGSLLPFPNTIADARDRAIKATTALMKQRFAEERETTDATSVHRSDGDFRYGVFITEAGIAALDVGRGADENAPAAPTPVKPERASKHAAVISLLQRDGGATLAELTAATGWLPHTARAALTGLRKKGHDVERTKRSNERCYRIAAGA